MTIKNIFSLTAMIAVGMFSASNANALEGSIKVANSAAAESYKPGRLVLSESTDKTDIYTSQWAGKTGKTIALVSEQVLADVVAWVKRDCGFELSDLKETRIVAHEPPVFYEVWVFNDKKSKREDGTSALSVVLKQLPNAGGVDVNFYGQCHSEKAAKFYVAK